MGASKTLGRRISANGAGAQAHHEALGSSSSRPRTKGRPPARHVLLEPRIKYVEDFLPGVGRALRPILERLGKRGCDLDQVVQAIRTLWWAAVPELIRHRLVTDAIPGTARCDAVLGRFDLAARELLALTDLPPGEPARPVLAGELGPQIRELLELIRDLHTKTAAVLERVKAEVQHERISWENQPRGRPKAWYRKAEAAFAEAGVPVRTQHQLVRLVAGRLGLKATYTQSLQLPGGSASR